MGAIGMLLDDGWVGKLGEKGYDRSRRLYSTRLYINMNTSRGIQSSRYHTTSTVRGTPFLQKRWVFVLYCSPDGAPWLAAWKSINRFGARKIRLYVVGVSRALILPPARY